MFAIIADNTPKRVIAHSWQGDFGLGSKSSDSGQTRLRKSAESNQRVAVGLEERFLDSL
jgi:hypothetical protein